MIGMRVRLKDCDDKTEGVIVGQLDDVWRVKWSDGLRGIYWLGQLEPL